MHEHIPQHGTLRSQVNLRQPNSSHEMQRRSPSTVEYFDEYFDYSSLQLHVLSWLGILVLLKTGITTQPCILVGKTATSEGIAPKHHVQISEEWAGHLDSAKPNLCHPLPSSHIGLATQLPSPPAAAVPSSSVVHGFPVPRCTMRQAETS